MAVGLAKLEASWRWGWRLRKGHWMDDGCMMDGAWMEGGWRTDGEKV